MKTPRTASLPATSPETLLNDYEHWLAFVTDSRQTLRQYDQQLAQISERYPDFSSLSDYLRNRMHYRTQFFGRLAIQLTATVAQLRADASNTGLLQRLTYTHQAMQGLIEELEAAFVNIEASYRNLLVTGPTVRAIPSAPSYRSTPARS